MKIDTDFKLEIKKTSRKKTISFIIKNNFVQIIAPKTLSDIELESFINKKSNWIERTLRANKLKTKIVTKDFESGEQFLYLGKKYSLNLSRILMI